MNSKFRQDLPPAGGYKPIQYLRVPAKTYFTGVQMFVGYLVIQFGGIYLYKLNDWSEKRMITEERSTRLALLPMLTAEKDRLYLKQLRKIRDHEAELMKDVKGWVLGTYWGEPIYLTRPKDELNVMTMNEFYVPNKNSDFNMAKNFYKYF